MQGVDSKLSLDTIFMFASRRDCLNQNLNLLEYFGDPGGNCFDLSYMRKQIHLAVQQEYELNVNVIICVITGLPIEMNRN